MDGTEERKDTSQSGDSSGGGQGTSGKEPETFTSEQVADAKTKAVSDALAAAGRTAKSLEKREEAATKAEERIVAEREEKRQAEIEAARNDPDALTALQKRHRDADRKAELDKRERELETEKEKHQVTVQSDLEQIRIFNRTKIAAEVAVDKGVSVDSLLKLTQEDTREAMEATAKILSEKKTPLKPDSGRTIGGKSVDELSPDEKIQTGLRVFKEKK